MCPEGKDSWCGWQRYAAGFGEPYSHHNTISQAVFEVLKPVWIWLSAKELLEKGMCQATQNANESFNGMVWHLCRKEGFASKETVETAVALSVVRLNDGAVRLGEVVRMMGCTVGEFMVAGLQEEDRKRVYHAEKKASAEEKRGRKRRRRIRKGLEERLVEQEGVTYATVEF